MIHSVQISQHKQKYFSALFIGLALAVSFAVANIAPSHASAANACRPGYTLVDGTKCVPNASNAPGATPTGKCALKPTFFGLVPWYQYLTTVPDSAGGCKITNFDNDHVLGSTSPFLLIALAVLDDLIRIAALVAAGFIIYGGIQYITSQGSPEDTKQAQQTIINALIGLVIALVAVALVAYIGSKLGGS